MPGTDQSAVQNYAAYVHDIPGQSLVLPESVSASSAKRAAAPRAERTHLVVFESSIPTRAVRAPTADRPYRDSAWPSAAIFGIYCLPGATCDRPWSQSPRLKVTSALLHASHPASQRARQLGAAPDRPFPLPTLSSREPRVVSCIRPAKRGSGQPAGDLVCATGMCQECAASNSPGVVESSRARSCISPCKSSQHRPDRGGRTLGG